MTDGPSDPPIRVLLADDQALIRDGIAVLLEASGNIQVVGQAADGAEAVALAAQVKPDVILMDIRMPGTDGIEATRQIAQRRPDPEAPPRVLILTTFDDDEYVYDALEAGASGFMLKDASPAELATAVAVVNRGDSLLAPSVTRRLISTVVELRQAPPSRPARTAASLDLSPRETEVLRLVARGLSNGEIAEQLVVSDQTVKTHVGHILTKLGVRDRTQAVIVAYESGLVGGGN
jgi:DNA-binding NarL/FixJ family response regulator